MKVYVVAYGANREDTEVVAVCLTKKRAQQVAAAHKADTGGYYDVTELAVDTEGMLLQPVVMRHYASSPEMHLSRDTELSAREWAAHLQRTERKGAYYYAALIVPLEPST